MVREYTHLPLGEPIEFISGSYWISAEDRIPYAGREVLCIVRDTSSISSCCGGYCRSLRSIGVAGYVLHWQDRRNADGLPISEVEPINDEEIRKDLRRIIQKKYDPSQVEFL